MKYLFETISIRHVESKYCTLTVALSSVGRTEPRHTRGHVADLGMVWRHVAGHVSQLTWRTLPEPGRQLLVLPRRHLATQLQRLHVAVQRLQTRGTCSQDTCDCGDPPWRTS